MEQKIRNSFISAFGMQTDAFHTGLTPEDVTNWDSLGHLRLVAALQQEFGIEFDVEEVMEMENVSKIVQVLQKRGIT